MECNERNRVALLFLCVDNCNECNACLHRVNSCCQVGASVGGDRMTSLSPMHIHPGTKAGLSRDKRLVPSKLAGLAVFQEALHGTDSRALW